MNQLHYIPMIPNTATENPIIWRTEVPTALCKETTTLPSINTDITRTRAFAEEAIDSVLMQANSSGNTDIDSTRRQMRDPQVRNVICVDYTARLATTRAANRTRVTLKDGLKSEQVIDGSY